MPQSSLFLPLPRQVHSFWMKIAIAAILLGTIATSTALEAKRTTVSQLSQSSPPAMIMPWLCLERCGATEQQALDHAYELCANATTAGTNAASFELFNLGPNSTLVTNNLTKVSGILNRCGLYTYAMVSSYPYPPQFLSWVRQLFANPTPFITALRAQLIELNLDGVNIDFEPTTAATATDAIQYALFLAQLQAALMEVKKTVSVDVAVWNDLWNFTLISEALSPVGGLVATMSTYTSDLPTFTKELSYAQATVQASALVVGMQVWPETQENPQQLQQRMSLVAQANVCRLGIWKWPLPSYWLQELALLKKRCGIQFKKRTGTQ